MPDHETVIDVETRYHKGGGEYYVAIASCLGCDWTTEGDESDVRDEAASHLREHPSYPMTIQTEVASPTEDFQLMHMLQSFDIFVERSKYRGDLWAEFDAEDSLHHCRSKLARIEALVLRTKDPKYNDRPESLAKFKEEALDDIHDLINYAVFTARHLEGQK